MPTDIGSTGFPPNTGAIGLELLELKTKTELLKSFTNAQSEVSSLRGGAVDPNEGKSGAAHPESSSIATPGHNNLSTALANQLVSSSSRSPVTQGLLEATSRPNENLASNGFKNGTGNANSPKSGDVAQRLSLSTERGISHESSTLHTGGDLGAKEVTAKNNSQDKVTSENRAVKEGITYKSSSIGSGSRIASATDGLAFINKSVGQFVGQKLDPKIRVDSGSGSSTFSTSSLLGNLSPTQVKPEFGSNKLFNELKQIPFGISVPSKLSVSEKVKSGGERVESDSAALAAEGGNRLAARKAAEEKVESKKIDPNNLPRENPHRDGRNDQSDSQDNGKDGKFNKSKSIRSIVSSLGSGRVFSDLEPPLSIKLTENQIDNLTSAVQDTYEVITLWTVILDKNPSIEIAEPVRENAKKQVKKLDDIFAEAGFDRKLPEVEALVKKSINGLIKDSNNIVSLKLIEEKLSIEGIVPDDLPKVPAPLGDEKENVLFPPLGYNYDLDPNIYARDKKGNYITRDIDTPILVGYQRPGGKGDPQPIYKTLRQIAEELGINPIELTKKFQLGMVPPPINIVGADPDDKLPELWYNRLNSFYNFSINLIKDTISSDNQFRNSRNDTASNSRRELLTSLGRA